MSPITRADRRTLETKGAISAFLGALAAVALWVGMSAAFPHLVFHLQPALVGIAAGWAVRREAGPGWSPGMMAMVAAASAIGVAVGIWVITAIDRPADPWAFTVLVAAAGVAVGEVVLLQGRPDARSASPGPAAGFRVRRWGADRGEGDDGR